MELAVPAGPINNGVSIYYKLVNFTSFIEGSDLGDFPRRWSKLKQDFLGMTISSTK